jgi:hypothetical protein
VLEIPTRLLRAAMASVVFVQGDVQSTRSASHLADSVNAPPQPVQKGQLLQEGDSLQVPANAFVSVRLADGSLVRVQSESDVELRQMRRKGRAGTLQSVIDLREARLKQKCPGRPMASAASKCAPRRPRPACAAPSFW